MEIGDLVKKRYGKIEPYQINTVGLVVGKHVEHRGPNPAFHGYWLEVLYPEKPVYRYRPDEFERV